MLLLQGEPGSVAAWARRGLMPVHVLPLDGWTVVLPAGPSLAMPPYDDPLKTLAGRPVASRLRTAIGVFAVDGNVVISAQRSGWRAVQRWYVWSPGQGLVQPERLRAGRPADLTAAAGIRETGARRDVRDILGNAQSDAQDVIGDLMAVLDLPGFDLLAGRQDPSAGATVVVPDEQHVARFEKIVNDEDRHRAELEED
jgi:hypothetical protein